MDTPTLTTEKPIGQQLVEAFDTLNRSERGHAALVQFRKFLEANDRYALGLDSDNWRALETLIRGCRMGGAYKICEALPKR